LNIEVNSEASPEIRRIQVRRNSKINKGNWIRHHKFKKLNLEPETGRITPFNRKIIVKDPKNKQDLTDQRLRIITSKSVSRFYSLNLESQANSNGKYVR
jgi:hypothetical protein